MTSFEQQADYWQQYRAAVLDYHRFAVVQALTETLYLARADVLDAHAAELAQQLKIPQIEAHGLIRPSAESVYRAAMNAAELDLTPQNACPLLVDNSPKKGRCK